MFQLIGKEINAILGTQTILIWTHDEYKLLQTTKKSEEVANALNFLECLYLVLPDAGVK